MKLEFILEPILKSLARVRYIFFARIFAGFWFIIGLLAFADGLVQEPARFSYALRGDVRSIVWQWIPFGENNQLIAEFVLGQTGLRLVFTLPSLFLAYLLSLVLLWIGSRVQMAFVKLMAENVGGTRRAFRETAAPANSLLLFRIGFATLAFVALTFVVLGSTVIVDESQHGDEGILRLVEPFAYIMVAVIFVLNVFLRNFVAPVMYRFGLECVPAIVLLLKRIVAAPLPFVIFFIVRLCWYGLVWVAWVVMGVATCGIGLIPVIHHALCAPIYAFDRIYSLYILEQAWSGTSFVADVPARGDEEKLTVNEEQLPSTT